MINDDSHQLIDAKNPMAKASKNTAAKSTSEKGKDSKSTEPYASKRGLKGHENSTKADDGDSVSLELVLNAKICLA
ncbi:hypothetical protein BDR04DRAFT_1099553 [Suillus decipiens]|nr:hypothetical protein BDR04DRAFT_1099553 [Suillus decipiens]